MYSDDKKEEEGGREAASPVIIFIEKCVLCGHGWKEEKGGRNCVEGRGEVHCLPCIAAWLVHQIVRERDVQTSVFAKKISVRTSLLGIKLYLSKKEIILAVQYFHVRYTETFLQTPSTHVCDLKQPEFVASFSPLLHPCTFPSPLLFPPPLFVFVFSFHSPPPLPLPSPPSSAAGGRRGERHCCKARRRGRVGMAGQRNLTTMGALHPLNAPSGLGKKKMQGRKREESNFR